MCYDYEDFMADEEDKYRALINEQAVYDIASKKVQEELDKLKDENKYFQKINNDLHSTINNLNKEKDSLVEEINLLKKQMDALKVTLTDEAYKEERRKHNPWGLTEGDTAYLVDMIRVVDSECPICDGKGEITIKNKKFICPQCQGMSKTYKNAPALHEVKVEVITQKFENDDFSGNWIIRVYYGSTRKYEELFYPTPRKVFKNKEDAEKRLKELER